MAPGPLRGGLGEGRAGGLGGGGNPPLFSQKREQLRHIAAFLSEAGNP